MSQTLNQFAYQLGCHARTTLAHSLVWHKAYVKADAASRTAWRTDFQANFVAGALNVSIEKAQAIVALKRTERTKKQEKAVNAASHKFDYHVSRDGAKSKPKTNKAKSNKAEPTKVRISAAERAAFEAFKKACGDAKRASAVFKALS